MAACDHRTGRTCPDDDVVIDSSLRHGARILFLGIFDVRKEKQRATELARNGLDTSFFRAELAAAHPSEIERRRIEPIGE
jgi:hypothetical protein